MSRRVSIETLIKQIQDTSYQRQHLIESYMSIAWTTDDDNIREAVHELLLKRFGSLHQYDLFFIEADEYARQRYRKQEREDVRYREHMHRQLSRERDMEWSRLAADAVTASTTLSNSSSSRNDFNSVTIGRGDWMVLLMLLLLFLLCLQILF